MPASVLVVGSGGREHALGWKLAQSPKVSKVYFAPGNGGTSQVGENVDISFDDIEALLKFAKENSVGLTIVGQEAALEKGIADKFAANGLKIFGPTAKAAQIETSKAFSAAFMERHSIPHPESTTVASLDEAKAYVKARSASAYVIKADGLATGKGVILPKDEAEATQTVEGMMSGEAFGDAGKTIVFQERLAGQEASAFALSDGKTIKMLPFFQDHKPIFDGDKGPNTGGMGAYTPVPVVDAAMAKRIEAEIMVPTINGMAKDGKPYVGVLYAGLFITKDGPKVIEYNARFGDPECQPMMLMLDTDLYELLEAAATGSLAKASIKTKPGAAVCVCLASGGYPGSYEKGLPISGLDSIEDENVVVFHAGTKKEGNEFLTNGGRVLNVTAYDKDLKQAVDKAYQAVKKINFEGMHYRKDIAAKALQSWRATIS